MRNLLKSFHFWAWLIFIGTTAFCYTYPRYIAEYEDFVDKAFAPLEWFFIYMMIIGAWLGVYMLLVLHED